MAIYCDKCGARHECSVCPVCAGFGLSKLQEAAGVGKSFQPTDELRAKFEATFPHLDFSADKYGNYYSQRTLDHLYGYQAGHASRDAEIEAKPEKE